MKEIKQKIVSINDNVTDSRKAIHLRMKTLNIEKSLMMFINELFPEYRKIRNECFKWLKRQKANDYIHDFSIDLENDNKLTIIVDITKEVKYRMTLS
jgi:hypothetical protein